MTISLMLRTFNGEFAYRQGRNLSSLRIRPGTAFTIPNFAEFQKRYDHFSAQTNTSGAKLNPKEALERALALLRDHKE